MKRLMMTDEDLRVGGNNLAAQARYVYVDGLPEVGWIVPCQGRNLGDPVRLEQNAILAERLPELAERLAQARGPLSVSERRLEAQ